MLGSEVLVAFGVTSGEALTTVCLVSIVKLSNSSWGFSSSFSSRRMQGTLGGLRVEAVKGSEP